jgi:hypothetical protein
MLGTFLVLISIAPMATFPVGSDCGFWPNHKGDRVLIACESDDGLHLSLLTVGGARRPIASGDADVMRQAVASGPATWSPADSHVALEVGLDEEPGVLLIDAGDNPSADFVDKVLVESNVSGAGPQWDVSGDWLIFRTSGTGDWAHEGVYARRIKDTAVFKLLGTVPRAMVVSNNTLFMSRSVENMPGQAEWLIFDLPKLLQQGKPVVSNSKSMSRECANKN